MLEGTHESAYIHQVIFAQNNNLSTFSKFDSNYSTIATHVAAGDVTDNTQSADGVMKSLLL